MQLWYDLVALLPFSWAATDGMYFMKNALLAILVISPLFGLLSTMVVQNHLSFFSDALGHSAFTGMAVGAVAGLLEQTTSAVIFALGFALLFSVVREKSSMSSDTIIGVFSSAALALGIFLSTLGGAEFLSLQQSAHWGYLKRGTGEDCSSLFDPAFGFDPLAEQF